MAADWTRARWVTALTAVVLAAGASGGIPAAAAPAAPAPPAAPAEAAVAPIDWAACGGESTLECATYLVPLDHQRPDGQKIELALSRRPAGDPARKIGSIFLNPGGPGGPGRSLPEAAPAFFTPDVLARFDVVGFDPRGVGESTPIRCFPDDLAAQRVLGPLPLVPVTRGQIVDARVGNRAYARACGRNAGPLLPFLSTADVARDLDLLRRAVGDDALNYLGLSYGTYLGATYANLFPDRVRALVLDGSVNPTARTRNRLADKVVQASGFEKALDGFAAACEAAGAPACALAGGPGARVKIEALRQQLRLGPLTIGPFAITLDSFTVTLIDDLYVVAGYQDLAADIQTVWEVVAGSAAASTSARTSAPAGAARRFTERPTHSAGREAPAADYSFNAADTLRAVNCLDTALPRDPAAYVRAAVLAEQQHPTFGRALIFNELACASWPVRAPQRYTGPWNTPTANPLLVVGTTFDPATPYVSSVAMQRQLADARLLTLDGYGHTSAGTSACVVGYTSRYLLAGTLPPVGTRCAQDIKPFAPVPDPSPTPTPSAPVTPAPTATPAPPVPTSSPSPTGTPIQPVRATPSPVEVTGSGEPTAEPAVLARTGSSGAVPATAAGLLLLGVGGVLVLLGRRRRTG